MNPYEKYLSKEDKLQRAVIRYCVTKYSLRPIPCNTESKKTRYEQFKFKQTGGYRGILDLFIPYPSNGYSGLFIELKIEGTKLFKKDGQPFAGAKGVHISNQCNEIKRLRELGYYANFGIGFDHTKAMIDAYFLGKINH